VRFEADQAYSYSLLCASFPFSSRAEVLIAVRRPIHTAAQCELISGK
jgi:hypothetical protein